MIQPQTLTEEYWTSFALSDSDIEQIYNYLLEVEVPRSTSQIARELIRHRVAEEERRVRRRLEGRQIYQPQKGYKEGDELVFPALRFAEGTVVATRKGANPQHGAFTVIGVEINGKVREFAAELEGEHVLNAGDGEPLDLVTEVSPDEIYENYGELIGTKVGQALQERSEFIQLAGLWFVKGLLAEVDKGHLHLAEAALELNEGGPLSTQDILVHLDMGSNLKQEVKEFSLNYALLQDDRFDEVGPRGQVSWFLRRLEPEGVQSTPERLRYTPVNYDEALLSPQLRLLIRELDDEWSDLEAAPMAQSAVLSIIYPHRYAGTLPLSARVRPLFPLGSAERQLFTLIDEETGERIPVWAVKDGRYVYGLREWYDKNEIPIGGYVHLKAGPDPLLIFLGYDRRRPQREWVRLASAADGRIKFELKRRAIGCGYDDLMIVGTDYTAAIDAIWRKAEQQQRSIASLLAEMMPELAGLTPQNAVHAKTLYSAINMLRRLPPAPVFAELVRNRAFESVGDHYWQFNASRWQG